jgi:hypothetical protein
MHIKLITTISIQYSGIVVKLYYLHRVPATFSRRCKYNVVHVELVVPAFFLLKFLFY